MASRCTVASLVAAATLALVALLGGGSASGVTEPKQPEQLIAAPGHVGEIHIGDTIKSLHRRHLIGGLSPGCELDPGQRVAPLRDPLEGQAIFFHHGKRLSLINVEAGARTATGVTTGSTVGEARKAYPKSSYDPPGNIRPFREGFVWINDSEEPRMTFVISPSKRLVEAISIPAPLFCE